jgi:hypothetical protein
LYNHKAVMAVSGEWLQAKMELKTINKLNFVLQESKFVLTKTHVFL